MKNQQKVLESLIAPLTTEAFFAEYWPERVYASHGDLNRLPEMFRSEVLRDIKTLSEHYHGRVLFTRGRHSPFMVPAENGCPKILFDMGLTVYMDNIQPCLPKNSLVLQALECSLGIPPGTARIGAFASPPGDGAACHYDTEDVISVQLTGTKAFHVAPVEEVRYPVGMQYSPGSAPDTDLYPQVAGRFPEWKDANFECIEMQPGSVLFMPRGTWHRTEADQPSLSITIAMCPPPAAETILENLRWLLLQDESWRRPLYGAYGETQQKKAAMAAAGQLLDRLPEQLRSLSTRSLELALMPEDQRLEHIDADSRFVSLPNASVQVGNAPDGNGSGLKQVSILVADDEAGDRITVNMEIHPQAVAVFEWLGSRNAPFSIGEVQQQFPQFPGDQHLAMLHASARAELIRMLWYPILDGKPGPDPGFD
ncbi:MAG: cupin domain-containing protein [Gammaproteobacteria bacterium]